MFHFAISLFSSETSKIMSKCGKNTKVAHEALMRRGRLLGVLALEVSAYEGKGAYSSKDAYSRKYVYKKRMCC